MVWTVYWPARPLRVFHSNTKRRKSNPLSQKCCFVLKVFCSNTPMTKSRYSPHLSVLLCHLLCSQCHQPRKTTLSCSTPCWLFAWCCCFLACFWPWQSFWEDPGPEDPKRDPRRLTSTRRSWSSQGRRSACQITTRHNPPKVSMEWKPGTRSIRVLSALSAWHLFHVFSSSVLTALSVCRLCNAFKIKWLQPHRDLRVHPLFPRSETTEPE